MFDATCLREYNIFLGDANLFGNLVCFFLGRSFGFMY